MKTDQRTLLFRCYSTVATACLLSFALCCAAEPQSDNEFTPQVQQLYTAAQAARQHGDDELAIDKYRAILKIAPHLAAAYNNLGMLYFDRRDYVQAEDVLERGLKLNPNMLSASAMLGMSYFQSGDNAKAEPYLRATLRANPSDDRVEMILIHILINSGRFEEAARHLNGFVARNPKSQEAWYLLGKTYLQLSEDALKKINEIDRDSVIAHEVAGEIDESMHNYDLALVEYKKAIDKAPTMPGTHMHMADAYWSNGQWKSAQTEYKAELLNDPNSCQARWKLGNAILEGNDSTDEALVELNAAVARCPHLMQARVDRARTLVRLGRPEDALSDLLLAEQDSPREPSIHFLLSSVYRAEGKTTEAQKEMLIYGQLQREARTSIAAQASDVKAVKASKD